MNRMLTNLQFTIYNLQTHKSNGFTLIELLLYVAILALMIAALVPLAGNIMTAGAKSAVQQEVASNGRFISEKIKSQIRQATSITSASGSNLVLSNGTFSLVSGKVRLGGVDLNSTDTTVTSLVFVNNSSADTKSKNVSFSFTISSNFNQARKEYQNTMNFRGSAEIRTL